MKSKIYNQSGKEVGTINLPDSIFAAPWNSDLVHQVVVSMQSNARVPVAHAKDRSEVRGGGKKPWRQKGTGRARHGSIRSPLWRGGGATFGPRNDKNYKKKINKKMRAKALYAVLSRKLADNELLFIDSLSLSEPKTAQAKEILGALAAVPHFEKLNTKRKNTALIALSEKNTNTEKSFRNFGNIAIGEVRNLNPVDILTYTYLILSNPKEALMFLEKKPTYTLTPKKDQSVTSKPKKTRSKPKVKAETKTSVAKSKSKLAPRADAPQTKKAGGAKRKAVSKKKK